MAALATLTGLVMTMVPVSPAHGFLGLEGLIGGGGGGGLLGLGVPRYTVAFESGSYTHNEDGGVATVVLERSGSFGLFGAKTTVHVQVSGGSATPVSDYEPVDVDVVFVRQEQFATVEVPLVGDGRYEHDETVTLTVEGDSNTAIGPQGSTTLTITNDDAAPEVSIAVPEPAVEGADVQASVTLEGATDVPATVRYATADGSAVSWSDYVAATGSITFAPGTGERTIAVPTIEDDVHEPSEAFVIELSDPVDATIDTGSAVAGINDDDVPRMLSIADTSASEGGAAQFTVTLSPPSSQQVSVDYATEDGTAVAPGDYTARTGTLTIDPGQSTATFDVPTAADDLPEPDEHLTVRLWNPQGAAIGDGTAVGTIVDAAPLPIVSIGHATTVLEGGQVAFPVTLSEPSESTITARVTPQTGTATAGVDFAAGALTATFPPGSMTTEVQITTEDDEDREDFESFRAVLSHASGATVGSSVGLATIQDNDQCDALDADQRRAILNRWLSRLDPGADADGDGFTNGEELGILAFDPVADPTRFNPFIADTPRVSVETIGDLSVALFDRVTQEDQIGQVRIDESELVDVHRQEDVHAVTEGHEVGVSGQWEAGVEESEPAAKMQIGLDYKYSRSTTHQQTSEITRGSRDLRSQEISSLQTQGYEIDGGAIAVTIRMTNTGNVAFRVESAPMILRYRDDARTLLAFGAMQPNFAFGQGPTLAPGQSKDVLYEVDGIGASDALALLRDASELEIGLADDLELSEIGVGNINVGAGNFAQYQDTIGQNTASFDIDTGRDGAGTDRYLVSTTALRDPFGRPLGLPMCDAVQVLLQRGVQVEDVATSGNQPVPVYVGTMGTEVFDEDQDPVGYISTAFTGIESGGPQPELIGRDAERESYWIVVANAGSVGGKEVFEPTDVLLRARQALQVVYYEDYDDDELELRDERIADTKDEKRDTDGDGRDDRAEVTEEWTVTMTGRTGELIQYPVRSDPTTADWDKDGLDDDEELDRGTDPWRADTDGDGIPDGTDSQLGASGISGSYYGSFDDLIDDVPTLIRTDEDLDHDWGNGSPASALEVDGFAVRWTGTLAVPETGRWTFRVVTQDWNRLFLKGVPVTFCVFSGSGGCQPQAGSIDLTAFEPVPLNLEFWDASGPASVRLEYLDDGGSWQTVPGSWLAPDPDRVDTAALGLSAEHYYDPSGTGSFDGATLVLREHDAAGPDHEYGTGSPKSHTVPYNDFLTRWTGTLVVPDDAPEGIYTIGGRHDEGMRVWLGNVEDADTPIYDGWDESQSTPDFGGQIPLTRGQVVPIRVEHYDKTGDSFVELLFTKPGASGPQEAVPPSWLRPEPAFAPFERELVDGRIGIQNNGAYAASFEVTYHSFDDSGDAEGRHSCHTDGNLTNGGILDCEIPRSAFDIEIKAFGGATQIGETHTISLWGVDGASRKCWETIGTATSREFRVGGCSFL